MSPSCEFKYMKYIIILLVFATLMGLGCIDKDAEEFRKSCPYELTYSGHYLRVPITITPNKAAYRIGDTVRIATIFTDSIQDLSTGQVFKIEDFPFKPLALLYRYHNGVEWDAGFRVNYVKVDSIYQPKYKFSTSYADHINSKTLYEGGMYRFEIELVLNERGTYILLLTDLYQEHIGSGNSELNAEADAITFEGKCPTLRYYICSMIEGEDNLELFEDELVHLDKEVYGDKLSSNSDKNRTGIYGLGSISMEWSGMFAFEVTE